MNDKWNNPRDYRLPKNENKYEERIRAISKQWAEQLYPYISILPSEAQAADYRASEIIDEITNTYIQSKQATEEWINLTQAQQELVRTGIYNGAMQMMASGKTVEATIKS